MLYCWPFSTLIFLGSHKNFSGENGSWVGKIQEGLYRIAQHWASKDSLPAKMYFSANISGITKRRNRQHIIKVPEVKTSATQRNARLCAVYTLINERMSAWHLCKMWIARIMENVKVEGPQLQNHTVKEIHSSALRQSRLPSDYSSGHHHHHGFIS